MDSSRATRAVVVFFVIAFLFPWLGWTALALSGLPHSSGLGIALFMTGGFCSIGGIVAEYVARGRGGVSELFRRAVRARVAPQWWAFALLLPLVWCALGAVLYGLQHGGVGPVKWSALARLASPSLLVWVVSGPLGEEFGWRGFLLPRMLERFRPRTASLVLGVIWVIWHVPLYVRGYFATPLGTLNFGGAVVCLALLLTLLHLRARASLLLAIVFHWAVNAAPAVVAGMFPAQPRRDGPDSYDLVAIVAVTVVFALASRLWRLPSEALLPDGPVSV